MNLPNCPWIQYYQNTLISKLPNSPQNHKLPTLSSISAITKIPTKSEITKLPLDCEITEMPLPVNGHRNSSDGDEKLRSNSSDLDESNGGGRDLPRALPAADRSSKIRKFPVVVRRFPGVLDDRGWSENDAGDVRSRTQLEVCPNSGEIDGGENGFGREFSISNHRRPGRFPATRMAWIRCSSLKLRIGTKLDRNGGRKWENRPGQSRGFRVGLRVKPGQTLSLSRAFSLFLFKSKTVPPFPFIKSDFFFFFFFFLSLIQIKLIPDPRRK